MPLRTASGVSPLRMWARDIKATEAWRGYIPAFQNSFQKAEATLLSRTSPTGQLSHHFGNLGNGPFHERPELQGDARIEPLSFPPGS